jgi:hypothetical protein
MFLGQSEGSNPIDISIHLWWSVALGAGATVVITQHNVLMTCLDVLSQEPLYMMWNFL